MTHNYHAMYKTIFNSIAQGFCVIDVLFNKHNIPIDIHYVEINETATTILKLIDIDKRLNKWLEIFGLVALTGENKIIEQYVEPDNRWYNFYIFKIGENNSRRIGQMFFDITEQKRMEESLRKSEKMLRTILDNSHDAINMLDLKTGKYVYMSPAQVRLTGFSKEELNNISSEEAFELIHPNDREMVREQQRLVTAGFDKHNDIVYRFKIKNGEYRWFSDRRKLVQDKNGKPIAIVGCSRDITENKNLNEALRENEERFHVLVNAVAQVVWESDASGEVFAEKETRSQTRNTYTIHDWVKAIHPEDREQIVSKWREAVSKSQNFDAEYRLKSLDGQWKWTKVIASPIFDSDNMITKWVGMNIDISERKEAENKLLFQSQLLSNVNDAIIAVNENDIIIYCNKAAEKLFGWQKNELIGKSQYETLVPQIRQGKNNSPIKGEDEDVHLMCKDGSSIIADVTMAKLKGFEGQPKGIIYSIRDITQRKQMEETLRKSEEKYRTLFNSMEEDFSIMDLQFDQNGRPIDAVILEANPSYERQHGVKDVIGKMASSLFPGHGDDWLDEYGLVAVTGKPMRFVKKAKSINKWHNILAFKIGGNDSRTVAVLGHDITEQKKAEAERALAVEKLIQSEKNAQKLVEQLREADQNKNHFLNVLSHELRNPMSAISAGMELLNLTEDKDQIAKAKEIIKRQMDHLCCLVEDLLDLTRICNNKIELKKEKVELKQLTALVMQDFDTLFASKGIFLAKDFDANALYVDGDPVRLTQIIGNLLHNALRFTDANGNVIVSVYKESNQAVICIRDTGIGIRPEILPRLFTPFVQVDQNLARGTGGLGLGLSIVKSITDLHGGSVDVYSAGLGKGSSFYIYLPLL